MMVLATTLVSAAVSRTTDSENVVSYHSLEAQSATPTEKMYWAVIDNFDGTCSNLQITGCNAIPGGDCSVSNIWYSFTDPTIRIVVATPDGGGDIPYVIQLVFTGEGGCSLFSGSYAESEKAGEIDENPIEITSEPVSFDFGGTTSSSSSSSTTVPTTTTVPDPCSATVCGDTMCEPGCGETEFTCAADCGSPTTTTIPTTTSTTTTIPTTTQPGDTTTSTQETTTTQEVTTTTLACTTGHCGDSICKPECGETETTCPADCTDPEPKTGDFTIIYILIALMFIMSRKNPRKRKR